MNLKYPILNVKRYSTPNPPPISKSKLLYGIASFEKNENDQNLRMNSSYNIRINYNRLLSNKVFSQSKLAPANLELEEK